ncbi:hypothetical protein RJ639_025304, partial [Escallonia herrerae]
GCYSQIGDLKGLFGLLMVNIQMLREKLKVLDVSYGTGTGNTALIYHQGKLLALSEVDKPYVLKVLEDGDLQTLGMLDYDKRLSHSFTAHPKVKCSALATNIDHHMSHRVISKDGFMNDPVPITVADPVMMHDFAITENYAIFMDLPMYFRPKEMAKENKLIFTFDATKKARFGVLPRYAKNELLIKWFELPNCFIFHNANAWEEGDEIVLITCIEDPDLGMVDTSNNELLEDFTNELYEMRFNLKTSLASQKILSAPAVDFPKHRKDGTGIVKFDLHAESETGKTNLVVGGNVRGIFNLGAGRFGSEAIFVPRQPGINTEEDDGYLILFVHHEHTGKSSVNVIDARTMSAEPVAVVELPHRVPYGFHALFVTEVSDWALFTLLPLRRNNFKNKQGSEYLKCQANCKRFKITGRLL